MSEEGWPDNPYAPGSFQSWLWNELHKKVLPGGLVAQKVVSEDRLQGYLDNHWTFVTQLKSGQVLVEKAVPAQDVLNLGFAAAKKKVLEG
jgi:hypothetical protein